MKTAFVLILAIIPFTLLAEEGLDDAKQRLRALELERNDYRRPDHGTLPEVKERQRQQLIGLLYLRDPLWKLQQELKTQIDAVLAFKDSPDTMADLECIKEALAISELVSDEAIETITKTCDQIRVSVLRRDREALNQIRETYK